jgi:signal transduction histidine kinase
MERKDSLIHFLFGKFRTKLMLLVLLPVLGALGLALERNFEHRRTEKAQVVQEIGSISRLIAANNNAYIKNARQILATLSGIDFLVHGTNDAVCNVHFQNLCKLLPDYLNFGLIESNGAVFSSAVIPDGPRPSLGDRSYFRRAVQARTFSIGEYQVGRLTEQPSLNFGYPIFDKSGAVERVLFASLKLDRIAEAAREVQAPEGAVTTIIDGGGTVLARIPDAGGWVGQSLPDMELVREVLRLQRGTLETPGLDRTNRIYAVTPISDDTAARIFVAVGMPTKLLFEGANRTLKRNLVILGFSVIATVLISYWFAERVFVRPISSLAMAADRLARGQLEARAEEAASTEELRDLSAGFNTMAERLQARDAELKKAHQEIQKINAELERKVLERTAQLTAANEELEAFSYSVSHDLRAPLRHLDGFAELLNRHQRERIDEKGQRYLDVISQSARKMGMLIDDLLVFSRMGRQELQRTAVDVGAMVREAIAQLQADYAGRQIEWKIGELRPVEADPAMLRQVWMNLISNAIKYTRPREVARIEIGSDGEQGQRVFFVRDNGVGFDMKYADKLFGVFQRLHAESEFEGTGIGLANVRRIISRHQGRTWAESVAGEGSTFYFSLPNKP